MPLLTDRQEPEDFDPNQPDEPNEYAIRYLFNPYRSGKEYERAGKLLLLSAAGTNILAMGLYTAWLEFNFNPWLLALAFVVVGVSGLAALRYNLNPPQAYFLSVLPLLITALTLGFILLRGDIPQSDYFYFFLPGSLALFVSLFLLRASHRV